MPTPDKRFRRSILLLGLSVVALAACGRADSPEAGSAPAAAEPRTLVRGNGPEPDSLDPQRARTVESANVLRDMYECLTAIGRDAAPIPAAAESWTTSADGLEWSFRLRERLAWSNGEPVTAADFVAGLQRLVDPATASQYAKLVDVIRDAVPVVRGEKPVAALGVDAPDARTVRIRLAHPAPHLPGLLTHPATCPIHRESVARFGDDFVRPGNHVSNGAFRMARWVQGSYIELERNPHYWNDAATQLERVRWISSSDENGEYRRFRAGELHVTATVPRGQIDEIRRNHPDELVIGPQLGTYFFGFNLEREPFRSQPGLRRALSLAIDRRRLVETVTRVGEQPAYGWVPPGVFGYSSQRFDYADRPMPERIAEARRLYAAAGYSAAKPLRFELRYNTGEIHSRMAVAVAQMWKEALGIDVSLVAVEFRVLQQEIDARGVDVFRLAWIGDYNDAYSFAQYLKSDFGINTPRYRSPAYDALLEAAVREADPAQRRARLEEAERTMLADHPLLPLYFYVNRHLVDRRVRGWYDNVMNVVYSKDLSLSASDAPAPSRG